MALLFMSAYLLVFLLKSILSKNIPDETLYRSITDSILNSYNKQAVNSIFTTKRHLKVSKKYKAKEKPITTRKDNLYNDNPYIIEIENELQHNSFIDNNATNNYVIVVCYAPWCPHCKHFVEPYTNYVRKHYNMLSYVKFAAVNCMSPELKKACKDVKGYPSVYAYNFPISYDSILENATTSNSHPNKERIYDIELFMNKTILEIKRKQEKSSTPFIHHQNLFYEFSQENDDDKTINFNNNNNNTDITKNTVHKNVSKDVIFHKFLKWTEIRKNQKARVTGAVSRLTDALASLDFLIIITYSNYITSPKKSKILIQLLQYMVLLIPSPTFTASKRKYIEILQLLQKFYKSYPLSNSNNNKNNNNNMDNAITSLKTNIERIIYTTYDTSYSVKLPLESTNIIQWKICNTLSQPPIVASDTNNQYEKINNKINNGDDGFTCGLWLMFHYLTISPTFVSNRLSTPSFFDTINIPSTRSINKFYHEIYTLKKNDMSSTSATTTFADTNNGNLLIRNTDNSGYDFNIRYVSALDIIFLIHDVVSELFGCDECRNNFLTALYHNCKYGQIIRHFVSLGMNQNNSTFSYTNNNDNNKKLKYESIDSILVLEQNIHRNQIINFQDIQIWLFITHDAVNRRLTHEAAIRSGHSKEEEEINKINKQISKNNDNNIDLFNNYVLSSINKVVWPTYTQCPECYNNNNRKLMNSKESTEFKSIKLNGVKIQSNNKICDSKQWLLHQKIYDRWNRTEILLFLYNMYWDRNHYISFKHFTNKASVTLEKRQSTNRIHHHQYEYSTQQLVFICIVFIIFILLLFFTLQRYGHNNIKTQTEYCLMSNIDTNCHNKLYGNHRTGSIIPSNPSDAMFHDSSNIMKMKLSDTTTTPSKLYFGYNKNDSYSNCEIESPRSEHELTLYLPLPIEGTSSLSRKNTSASTRKLLTPRFRHTNNSPYTNKEILSSPSASSIALSENRNTPTKGHLGRNTPTGLFVTDNNNSDNSIMCNNNLHNNSSISHNNTFLSYINNIVTSVTTRSKRSKSDDNMTSYYDNESGFNSESKVS